MQFQMTRHLAVAVFCWCPLGAKAGSIVDANDLAKQSIQTIMKEQRIPGLQIAVVNHDRQTVVSGDDVELNTLGEAAARQGIGQTILKSRYPFSLAPEMLRVAVNAEFGEWSQRLADGDSVVFIPPVAGG